MRVPAFATIASFVLLAAPALAQTSNMTVGQTGDTSTSSHVPPDTAVTLDTQQKLKQSLEQSGFKKVVVRSVRHSRPGSGRFENCHGSEPRSDAGDH
jgi:hypothetical protein